MQAVGQLAGGVAHDFNNLLTAIIGYCDLLLMRHRPADPSLRRPHADPAERQPRRDLVRQLLAFSRKQTLQPRVLDLSDVLAELTHLLRRLLGENVELRDRSRPRPRAGPVDQRQLEQVIINLASTPATRCRRRRR